MKVPTMFDSFRHEGWWWPVDEPKNKQPGVLTFDPDADIKLKLLNQTFGGELYRHLNIEGQTSNKYIYLFRCFETKRQDIAKSMYDVGWSTNTSEYVTNQVLVSEVPIDYDSSSDDPLKTVKFSSLRISFIGFEEWLAVSPFDNRDISLPSQYNPPSFEDIYLSAIDATVSSDYSAQPEGEKYKSLIWEHTAFIKITPDNPQSPEWFLEQESSLGKLLTILMGVPAHSQTLLAMAQNAEGKEIPTYIYLRPRYKPVDVPSPEKMILSAKTLGDKFPHVIEKWFEKEKVLEPFFHLFVGVLFNKSTDLIFKFLAFVQALESYHRNKFGGVYMPEKEYQVHYEMMANAIPKKLTGGIRNKIKNSLKYGYQFSQRKRLKDILKKIPKRLQKIIGITTCNYSKYIDTRNYYTHYDSDDYDKAWHDFELYEPTNQLGLLITSLILKELELPDEMIKKAVSRRKKFHQL